MSDFVFKPFTQDKSPVVLVQFDYNADLVLKVKSCAGRQWSRSLVSWYLPADKTVVRSAYKKLKKHGCTVDVSLIDTAWLDPFVNFPEVDAFKSYLIGLRLSKSTIESYTGMIAGWAQYMRPKKLSDMNSLDLRSYIEHKSNGDNFSVSTHRQFISAVKHYAEMNGIIDLNTITLTRPKRSQFKPVVLSEQEVIHLLQSTVNLKHRFIIGMLYSCGLRVGELCNMRVADLDLDRLQVHVQQSKGRKDRYTGVAQSMLPMISNYLKSYQPTEYLVEGKADDKRYNENSIRAFIKRSCKKANIIKKVTPHTLRHSYATHMIENGVGLRHVQDLLGHSKPETTMLYTHIAKKDLIEVPNPLDKAVLKYRQSDKNTRYVHISRQ